MPLDLPYDIINNKDLLKSSNDILESFREYSSGDNDILQYIPSHNNISLTERLKKYNTSIAKPDNHYVSPEFYKGQNIKMLKKKVIFTADHFKPVMPVFGGNDSFARGNYFAVEKGSIPYISVRLPEVVYQGTPQEEIVINIDEEQNTDKQTNVEIDEKDISVTI